MKTLVSVIMPSYNARTTLPAAIASLLLQTHQDWECIIVDDGSTDGTVDLVAQLDDRRLRYLRLAVNRGRGVARQIALERARGNYLAFLDADDWYYPDKIERQLSILRREPEVAIVSTGMAVVSNLGELTGVRRACLTDAGVHQVTPPLQRLSRPPMSFPTCMVRMEAARQASYNPRLHLAQDFDFMLSLLRRYAFATLSELCYVYREESAQALHKMIQTRRYDREVFWSYRTDRPLDAIFQVALATAKEMAYRGGRLLDLDRHLVNRRSQSASATETDEFLAARQRVTRAAITAFPTAASFQ